MTTVLAKHNSKPKPLHWNTYIKATFLALACMGLFGVSALVSGRLSVETRSLITSINLVLAVVLMIISFVKQLSWLRLPVIVLLSATGGVVVSLLAGDFPLVGTGMGIAFGLVIIVTLFVALRWFNFQRFRLLLSVLTLTFSVLGSIILHTGRLPALIILCAVSAIVCLCGLLHNTVHRILTEVTDNAHVSSGAGMFMLWVGLVVNTVILLQARIMA